MLIGLIGPQWEVFLPPQTVPGFAISFYPPCSLAGELALASREGKERAFGVHLRQLWNQSMGRPGTEEEVVPPSAVSHSVHCSTTPPCQAPFRSHKMAGADRRTKTACLLARHLVDVLP